MDPGDPAETPEVHGYEWRPGRVIPWRELVFRQDAAGGPGGQHANRSATRVTLTWRPLESTALREDEKARLREAWSARLSLDGTLQIRSGEERSARQNRERCLAILRGLLREGLKIRRKRRPTKPTKASKKRRLDQKRQRSEKKQRRRPPDSD